MFFFRFFIFLRSILFVFGYIVFIYSVRILFIEGWGSFFRVIFVINRFCVG